MTSENATPQTTWRVYMDYLTPAQRMICETTEAATEDTEHVASLARELVRSNEVGCENDLAVARKLAGTRWNVSSGRTGTKITFHTAGVGVDVRLERSDAVSLATVLLSGVQMVSAPPEGSDPRMRVVPGFIWDQVCERAGISDPLPEYWEGNH